MGNYSSKLSNIHADVAFVLCLSPILLRDMKTERPQTTLIEAQLKHANALILFSLGEAPWQWHII